LAITELDIETAGGVISGESRGEKGEKGGKVELTIWYFLFASDSE